MLFLLRIEPQLLVVQCVSLTTLSAESLLIQKEEISLPCRTVSLFASSKERRILVTQFYVVHAGLVPECEGQVATKPESTREWSATISSGERQQHQRRGTPIGGLSLGHPGGQQQSTSLRRGSPSPPPPRPNDADPQLRRPILATPFTVLSTIQFLKRPLTI